MVSRPPQAITNDRARSCTADPSARLHSRCDTVRPSGSHTISTHVVPGSTSSPGVVSSARRYSRPKFVGSDQRSSVEVSTSPSARSGTIVGWRMFGTRWAENTGLPVKK